LDKAIASKAKGVNLTMSKAIVTHPHWGCIEASADLEDRSLRPFNYYRMIERT